MKITVKTFKTITIFVVLIVTVSGVTAYASDVLDHTKYYDPALFVTSGKDVNNITWWYGQEGEKDFTDAIITAADAWNDTPRPLT